MTKSVVTGAAGFVGSHLCEHLLSQGEDVVGLDCFTDYYDPALKEQNVAPLLRHPRFRLIRSDLGTARLAELLPGVDVVYHLAGQPGVRASWGEEFAVYVERNVTATQRLLEACRSSGLGKLVYASSSSVYGDAEAFPTSESLRPQPVSPYGVTKLAGEHLCELYRKGYDLPTASLRFFTVYGPRQRPDMAFARLVKAAVRGGSFELYGDGTQTRDFTFVSDIVAALHAAGQSTWTGVANVGGGSRSSMNEVLDIVTQLTGSLSLTRRGTQRGDVRHTSADIHVAREGFGYQPRVRLAEGLARMVQAERELAQRDAPALAPATG